MATADAADAYEMHGKRVVFGDGNRKFWSPVFEHNPKIAKDPEPDEIVCWVPNYIGHRPYITEIGETHFKVREDFRVKPGEIYLTDEERRWAEKHKDFILIEPNVKDWSIGFNKAWPYKYWKELIKAEIAEISDQLEIPKRLLNKLVRVYHKQNYDEEVTTNEQFVQLYETVVK